MRGFESVGPKAAAVAGGTEHGDVLGGNAMFSAAARVLLPPPLPSITLANAGLRSQCFASMGVLLPRADVATLGSAKLDKHLAASAGVGLVSSGHPVADLLRARTCLSALVPQVLPLADSLAIEANWALWHKAGASDVVSALKLQLTL